MVPTTPHESSTERRMMVIVLMGVAGSGKTTIGKLLSKKLGWKFFDGDDFHPPGNVEKMRSGIPLTDEDRSGWLSALRGVIDRCLREKEPAVLACSALKQSYRNMLHGADDDVRFVFLKGDPTTIASRLGGRKGHFMNPALLQSQFAALEEPQDAITVDVSRRPEEVVSFIRDRLRL
jgi:gluconokinase